MFEFRTDFLPDRIGIIIFESTRIGFFSGGIGTDKVELIPPLAAMMVVHLS